MDYNLQKNQNAEQTYHSIRNSYTLPEDNHQIFASKYFTYLPSEEELKRELNLKEFHKKEE